MIDPKREKVQKDAFDAFVLNNEIGCCEISTGVGKTTIAFKAMLNRPVGSNVLFLAETTVD